jgi:hypothetical protein
MVGLKFALDAQPSRWRWLFALFVSIHVCASYYGRRSGGPFQSKDLVHLSLSCAIAFCLVDEGVILALRWMGLLGAPESHAFARAVIAIVVDTLIVFAMVFVTVPLGSKVYIRRGVT